MPIDPRLWTEGPIRSTYPACMAVKAAAEQGADAAARYLRALREGLMCMRRKLDAPEALVEEARAAGLDVQRFRIDLGSHAIVEAFGADLDEPRAPCLPSASPSRRSSSPPRRVRSGCSGKRGYAVLARPRARRAPGRRELRRRTCRRRCGASAGWPPPRSRRSATCPARAPTPSCGASPPNGGSSRCAC